MSLIKIVTDSSAALTKEEIKKYDITVVPLQVFIDGKSYLEGVDITHEQFFKKMEQAKDFPKSSQPAVINFYNAYQDILKKDPGAQILSIHMSTGLSSTGLTAQSVSKDFNGKVTYIDSHSIDRGLAFQVLEAGKMVQEGSGIEEIIARLKKVAEKTRIFLTLESLKNLVAGGRINKATGLIGSFLNIKVGIEFIDDSIKTIIKGRGEKTVNKFFDQLISDMHNIPNIKAIGVSHVDADEKAHQIGDRLKKLFPNVPVVVLGTAPIIATHTGIGTLCILYYSD
ncbi:DegV family protein [Oenococcus alcoholitolerans]|uniref:DegV family protein n=1 Tax=Oenococcus alcoholitolerans TaxID=931074 RepID=UPI003F706CE5